MLIDPEIGSWHFIGALLTSLENDLPAVEIEDRCGDCTACVTACPTDAIRADRLVDSNRCLSYLTIEHRGAFPEEAAGFDFAGNIFGCDICQEVCPWNARTPVGHPAFETRAAYRNTPIHDLLRMSPQDFSTMFRKSAVKRAKRAGLVRNAITIAAEISRADADLLAEERDPGIRAALTSRRVKRGGPSPTEG
jgi:epoxyqueuosine reductase